MVLVWAEVNRSWAPPYLTVRSVHLRLVKCVQQFRWQSHNVPQNYLEEPLSSKLLPSPDLWASTSEVGHGGLFEVSVYGQSVVHTGNADSHGHVTAGWTDFLPTHPIFSRRPSVPFVKGHLVMVHVRKMEMFCK